MNLIGFCVFFFLLLNQGVIRKVYLKVYLSVLISVLNPQKKGNTYALPNQNII